MLGNLARRVQKGDPFATACAPRPDGLCRYLTWRLEVKTRLALMGGGGADANDGSCRMQGVLMLIQHRADAIAEGLG